MRIVCPQCGYSRDIPAEKVPSRSSMATCPKCQFRFRFRGPSASPRPEEDAQEPVYPPKPSRPQVEREPYDAAPGVRFEPRTSRLYQSEPEAGHEYGHVPPRPQARWLPDPEPGYPEAEAPLSRPLRARPRPETLEEPVQAEGLEAPWERSGAGQPLEPLDFPGEQPAPWERMGQGQPAPKGTPDQVPVYQDTVIDRPGQEHALQADAGPVPSGNGEGADQDRVAEMAGMEADDPQPAEAVAGDDSVRDIWARLQAMGGDAKPLAQAVRQEGEPEARSMPIGPDTVAPWEQLEHYGVVPAFLATVKNILLKPGDFYDQLPPVTGKARPLIFAMTVCLLAMLAGVVWNYFGMGPNLSELGRTDGFQGLGSGAIGGLALLGLAPLALVAFVFLDASLTHLLLGLLRSASRSFEETFRTVCYAGAPWLLAALPVPSSYLIPVVLIWHMTLQAIGLKKLHRAGYPQVLASVLVKWSLYFMASFAILHVLITRR